MKLTALIASVVAVGAFGVFVVLAYSHVILVPYFSPVKIEIHGLEDQYPVNGSMKYSISLKGYGSNCIVFESEVSRNGSIADGSEIVAYFNQVQDCRTIEISQGSYGYNKDFSYSGNVVLGKQGDYTIKVNVHDQVTGQNYNSIRSFKVI